MEDLLLLTSSNELMIFETVRGYKLMYKEEATPRPGISTSARKVNHMNLSWFERKTYPIEI